MRGAKVGLGSNLEAVAQELGRELDAPVQDRDIVEHIATHENVRAAAVETLDEHAMGAIEDYITDLMLDRRIGPGDYIRALVGTVLMLVHHGPCIVVGRGAANILPSNRRLAVRLVASKDKRLERVAASLGVPSVAAAT